VTAFSGKFVHVAVAVNDHVNVNDHEKSYFRTGTSWAGRTAALNRLGFRRVEPGRLEAMWIATGRSVGSL
jgi:hypothetical protein